MTVLMERGCFERGCACYDDRIDKDFVEVDEVKTWDTDDLIATLEQENRQLRARNERLEKENNPANESQVMAMWKVSNGHVLRFARMLESYHGIGEIEEAQNV